jgi:glycine dehydrogenase subunit 1
MPYIAHTPEDVKEMCAEIGVSGPDALFQDIPESIRRRHINLPPALSEWELKTHMEHLAKKTQGAHSYDNYLGAGAYEHFIPSVVQALISRGEFATSYTPYQAEASQGTLQAIFEFQTLIAQLTGMDIANASLYDGASAFAEGAILSWFAKKRPRILVSETVHPEYRRVVKTYLRGLPIELVTIPMRPNGTTDWQRVQDELNEEVNALLISSPNFFGQLEEIDQISKKVHEAGALLVEHSHPIALSILKSPGEHHADIAVGETQPLGIATAFGGPYCGWLAAKKEWVRRIPGRLVSETVDRNGDHSYVLTLQTREQHIRRERATSNICTNEGLCALASTITLTSLGPQGLREMAELNLANSHYIYEQLLRIKGIEAFTRGAFFNEFAIQFPRPVREINQALLKEGILGGLDLGRFWRHLDHVALFCVTETKTRDQMDKLIEKVAQCLA